MCDTDTQNKFYAAKSRKICLPPQSPNRSYGLARVSCSRSHLEKTQDPWLLA